jgi:hypothetical protein
MKILFLLLILLLESVSFGQTVELRTTTAVPPQTFVKERRVYDNIPPFPALINTLCTGFTDENNVNIFWTKTNFDGTLYNALIDPTFANWKSLLWKLTGVQVSNIVAGTSYPVTNLSLWNNLNMNGYYLCHDATIGFKIFLFTTPLSSESFNSNSLSIYPNPTKNLLHIDLQNELSGKITDLTGKILMTINTKDIDVSSLSAGIYLLDITSEGKHYTKKIMKE